jgi:hypothetical protein
MPNLDFEYLAAYAWIHFHDKALYQATEVHHVSEESGGLEKRTHSGILCTLLGIECNYENRKALHRALRNSRAKPE